MSTTTRRTLARALALVGALALGSTAYAVAAPTAGATTTARTTSVTTAESQARMTPVVSIGARAVSIAASRRGSPYVYGASGPHRFDCSGLTMWTFDRLHHRLPHSAAAQYGRVRHIRASQRRVGDLVFFHDGSGIYHVGIYAGHNMIWHAPYPGEDVRKERLWTNEVYYGRVR